MQEVSSVMCACWFVYNCFARALFVYVLLAYACLFVYVLLAYACLFVYVLLAYACLFVATICLLSVCVCFRFLTCIVCFSP